MTSPSPSGAPPATPLQRVATRFWQAARPQRSPEAIATMTGNAAPVDAAHFDAPVCRNCGATLATLHCGQCGQKKAARFHIAQLRSEAWQSYRLFEWSLVRAALRLAVQPGTVAREYVLGARARHIHPLKLLLVAVGLLLLVLGQTHYLDSGNANVSRAMALVQQYGKWSFSLGIVAIVLSSLLVFRRRLGYNFTEHLVLAVYTHFLILSASVLNLLPLLAAPAPEWIALHKQLSKHYMALVEAGIVGLAFGQFFRVDLRRQWWRLLLAVALFVALKKTLQYLYALSLVKLVLARLA